MQIKNSQYYLTPEVNLISLGPLTSAEIMMFKYVIDAALSIYCEFVLSKERHQHPQRLTRFGKKVFSQNDEDGIIAEIFRRIGNGSRHFVEFGVESGVECNTLWLLMQGWSGLWIEGSKKATSAISRTHAKAIQSGRLKVKNQFVTAGNIDKTLQEYAASAGTDIDLLSIDIDSNDYWIWKAISGIKPRVVVIEYNASWPPPACITIPYSEAATWDRSNFYGASLGALEKLGNEKGYALVGCCLAGVNAFFVRKDLLGENFMPVTTAEEHYEPPRYFLGGMTNGHPSKYSEVVSV